MLLQTPKELQYFFQIIFINFNLISKEQRNYIKATVCSILCHQEKVSMRIIGSILGQFQRSKSAVSKMYSNSNYFSQEVAWQSMLIVCKLALQKLPKKCPWVLVFDTTHRSRFGKLLKNLIGTHGKKSKKRFFPCVWSILLCPHIGTRIAIPCPIWCSKEYAKENNLSYKSQPQLAVLTLKWLGARLKKQNINFDLVIVADSAFECSALWKLCHEHNHKEQSIWSLITCCSADRCLGFGGPKASRIPGAKVHLQFTGETFFKTAQINFYQLTNINVRSQRKLQSRQQSFFYRYAKKQLRISEIGDASVVMSYKLKHSNECFVNAPVKFFLCSNLEFSAEQIISYYTLRWEVETFFREQKSDLAFNHFQAWNPLSCYRFIDHLTIAFNFLEFYRIRLIDSPDFTLLDSQQSLTYARSRKLKELFRKQAFVDRIQWILDRTKTSYGIRRLRQVFLDLNMPFNSFSLFY